MTVRTEFDHDYDRFWHRDFNPYLDRDEPATLETEDDDNEIEDEE